MYLIHVDGGIGMIAGGVLILHGPCNSSSVIWIRSWKKERSGEEHRGRGVCVSEWMRGVNGEAGV